MNFLAVLLSTALAQESGLIGDYPEFNAQSFRSSIDSKSFFWVTDSSLLGKLYTYKANFTLTDSPLVFTDYEGNSYDVLGQIKQLDLIGTYRWGNFRVGVSLPVFIGNNGLSNEQLVQMVNTGVYSEPTTESGLGDALLDGKLRIMEGEIQFIGLATSARFTLPTSNSSLPLGALGPTMDLELNIDKKIRSVRVAANVGRRFQQNAELLDSLRQSWGSGMYTRWGLAYDLQRDQGISLEYIQGVVSENSAMESGEALLSFRSPWEDSFVKTGVSIGIGEGIGTPSYRFLVSIEPSSVIAVDSDRDGIMDANDVCPSEAEDFDGVLDSDGCYDGDEVVTPIIAVGDLKGDLENTKELFLMAGIINAEEEWLQKDIAVVQVGDLTDANHDARELMLWLRNLEKQAKRKNSRLYILPGDYDVQTIRGERNYVASGDAEQFREGEETDASALSSRGIWSSWMQGHDAVVNIEGNLFSHGGIPVEYAKDAGQLSLEIRDALISDQNLPVVGSRGPIFATDYWDKSEDVACYELDILLSKMNAKRLITAHPARDDGKIGVRCQGRLIGIDTGIASHDGDNISAIRIDKEGVMAIYSTGSELIVSKAPPLLPHEKPAAEPSDEEAKTEEDTGTEE